MPTKQVNAGMLAGALSILTVYLVKLFTSVEVPAEPAQALTAVLTFLTQYWLGPNT